MTDKSTALDTAIIKVSQGSFVKDPKETLEISCLSPISNKEDDDVMIIKLDADDKTELEAGGDTPQQQRESHKVFAAADLQDGKTCSQDVNDGKKKSSTEKNMIAKITEPIRERIKIESNYLWVSNIHKNVKAADLKTLFSKVGKVFSAKILTNGKHFYGYVTVENEAVALKCMRQLNNLSFQGDKIVVTNIRPDLRDPKATSRDEAVKNKLEKMETKKEGSGLLNSVSSKNMENAKPTEEHSDKENSDAKDSADPVTGPLKNKSNNIQNRQDTSTNESKVILEGSSSNVPNKTISKLKKKIELLRSDNYKMKQKFQDYQGRNNNLLNKCFKLEKEIKELRSVNQDERKRFQQEKENFEKKKKLDIAMIDADKAALIKEIAENKRLKNHLKSKLEEVQAASAKLSKRKRSPCLRNVLSPQHRKGTLTPHSGSNTHFGGERAEKRTRRDDISPRRTPSSPTKIPADTGRKRCGDNTGSHRPYYSQDLKRLSPTNRQFEYRRKQPFSFPMETPRTDWNHFQKGQRRNSPVPLPNYSGSGSKYGTTYPLTTSNISVPVRGNHDNHYFPQSQW